MPIHDNPELWLRDPEADPYINWLGINPLVLLGDIDNVFVAITPFILEVNIPVEVEKSILLFVIIVVVAIIPLIVVVKVLSVISWLNELMNCFIPEETPLIIFSKKLLDVEAMLVLIIFTLLELDPPTLEESVLLDEVRVLLVLRLVTFRLFVVKLVVVASVAVRLIVLVVVAVIVSVKRLVKYPVTLLNILEKKLVEEEFMKLELVEERLLDVRLLVNRLLRERSDPCILEMIVEEETSMLGMREERSIVAIEPPRLEVNILPFNDNVLLVFRLVIVKLVDVPLVIVVLPIIALERLAVLELRLEIKAFVWVAFSELILVRLSNGRVLSSVLPLTVETILNPLVEVERVSIFSLIIVEVEMIPFTLEIIVNVSPVLDIFNILFLIIVVVAIDPPRLESNSLSVFWERVLLVLRLVTFRLFVVKLVVVASDAVRLIVLVVVAVIVSVKRLVKYPVTLLNILENKLLDVALIDERFCILAILVLRLEILALVIVALPKIGLSVNI